MADYTSKIAQQLGISIDSAHLFILAAREYEGKVLRYRQILSHLEDGYWSAEDVKRIAAISGITVGERSEAIRALADALGTSAAEAIEFIQNVDQHFPETLDAKDILTAVQELDSSQLTVRRIIEAVETNIIARELNLEKTEAQELPAFASELSGFQISNQDILNLLRTADETPSIDYVLASLEEKSGVIQALAGELGEAVEDARQFANYVRQEYSWATDEDILQAVQSLEESERKVQSIYASLETLLISRTFAIERERAIYLPDFLEQETGFAISRTEILRYILDAGWTQRNKGLDRLIVICHVAAIKKMSLPRAEHFVDDVLKRCNVPATELDFSKAFDITSNPRFAQEVAKNIEMNMTAAHLGIDLDDLRVSVEQTLGVDVSRDQLLQHTKSIGEGVTSKQIIDHLKEEFAEILLIANEMDVMPADVGGIIGQIQKSCNWPVNDDDVVKALQLIDGHPKTVQQVVDQLKIQRIADELQISVSRARELSNIISGRINQTISNNNILETLAVLSLDQRNTEDLIAILQLANALDIDPQEVMITIGQVEKALSQPISLNSLWQTVREIEAQKPTVETIVDYLTIQHYIEADHSNRWIINRAVDFLSSNRHKAEQFWTLLEQFRQQDALSVSDIDYLINLVSWPFFTLSQLRSSEGAGMSWLIASDVQRLMEKQSQPRTSLFSSIRGISQSDRRQNQISGLRNLSRQCWNSIRSNERRYQVPSRGRAEIIAPDNLKNLINLRSIQFVQEGVSSPGVFLRFKFDDANKMGFLRVDGKGILQGFHELTNSAWFQALIEAIALSFYRDLVIPVNVYQQARQQTTQRIHKHSPPARTRPRPRTNPSRRVLARTKNRIYRLSDWHESQEIARHLVRGHRRYIGPHFEADWVKKAQARAAGVTLQRGETWVIEHERGDPQYRMPIELDGEDLTRHTLFSSPTQATEELDRILF